MSEGARPKPFHLVLAGLWGAWIHVLSGAGVHAGPGGFFWTYLRNGGHAFLFLVLALLLALGLPGRPRRRLLVFVLATLFGAYEEWRQLAFPGRSASLFDLATDACGAALGVLAGRALLEASGAVLRTAGWRLWLPLAGAFLFPLADTLHG